MADMLTRFPDERRLLYKLNELVKASTKFRWRLLAIIVAIASVVSAVFQVLNFFCR